MEFTIGLGIVIIAVIVVIIRGRNKRDRELREAKANYRAALTALQEANTSANRVRVLEQGRYYASLCREGGNVAMFDEVALQNDLKAYAGD